ncbi:MAG: ATP-dependent DNA ligase [Leifsonia xyli]|nr:MAG: ATP-dependent DNA ligase [Leifsonia xyli]
MGSLIYGSSGIEISFDDRVLAHLELVIGSKLRRRESFMLSWRDTPGVGDGRSSIWVDTGIPFYFRYSGSRMPLIDKDWLDELAAQAGSNRGLVLGEDPATEQPVKSVDNSVKRKDHPAR